MADKEIKITFPEKKMEALVFFLVEQNEKIEDVLTAHLDKTYEKYMPRQSDEAYHYDRETGILSMVKFVQHLCSIFTCTDERYIFS